MQRQPKCRRSTAKIQNRDDFVKGGIQPDFSRESEGDEIPDVSKNKRTVQIESRVR